MSKPVVGDSLLYNVFHERLEAHSEESEEVVAFANDLIAATSIWLPVEIYKSLPTLVPWVTRDPSCRRPVDEWGAPDIRGFQRDDNSMVKGIPRSLLIRGPKNSMLTGKKIGTGFVASHVWRSDESKDKDGLRNPRTNSFVPNLVWLPGLIAYLSDRPGSTVMRSLQSLSRRIYGEVEVEKKYAEYVEDCWDSLPPPSHSTESIDISALHFFDVDEKFIKGRMKAIHDVSEFVDNLLKGQDDFQAPKTISSRYVDGLPNLSRKVLGGLRDELRIFLT